MDRAPVPFFSTEIVVSGDHSYFLGLSVYSNVLHLILSVNGRPGVLVMFTPHSKLGNDPNQLYTIRELLGRVTEQQELLLKQIASTAVIAENAIPFLCNLMIPQQIDMDEMRILIREIQDFISANASLILKHYRRSA